MLNVKVVRINCSGKEPLVMASRSRLDPSEGDIAVANEGVGDGAADLMFLSLYVGPFVTFPSVLRFGSLVCSRAFPKPKYFVIMSCPIVVVAVSMSNRSTVDLEEVARFGSVHEKS